MKLCCSLSGFFCPDYSHCEDSERCCLVYAEKYMCCQYRYGKCCGGLQPCCPDHWRVSWRWKLCFWNENKFFFSRFSVSWEDVSNIWILSPCDSDNSTRQFGSIIRDRMKRSLRSWICYSSEKYIHNSLFVFWNKMNKHPYTSTFEVFAEAKHCSSNDLVLFLKKIVPKLETLFFYRIMLELDNIYNLVSAVSLLPR